MTAFTAALPGNRSRTRTQAMIVPNTALIRTTISEHTRVSFSAAMACVPVTASQNEPVPLSNALAATAASGRRTMTLRYSVTIPMPRPAPARGRRMPVPRAGALAVVASIRSACGRDPELLLDLRDLALRLVEELVVDLVPAAELVNREEVLRRRKLLRVHQLRVDRPVAVLRPDLLTRIGPDEVHEVLRRLRRLLRDRDRRLDQDRRRRDHVVHVLALGLGLDRLVLIRDEDVALALGEGCERVAAGPGLHLGLREDGLDRVERLLRGLALVQLRPVDGHDVPARRARAERVRGDHADVLVDQVVERVDALRVPLADDQDGNRVLSDPLVLLLVPVRGDEAGVDQPGHVTRLGE